MTCLCSTEIVLGFRFSPTVFCQFPTETCFIDAPSTTLNRKKSAREIKNVLFPSDGVVIVSIRIGPGVVVLSKVDGPTDLPNHHVQAKPKAPSLTQGRK